MTAIRVVVVDDHPFYREGVKSMVPLIDPGIEVVGEAGTGEEALIVVAAVAPDVVLMDLAMPGMTGVAATRTLRAEHPGVQVLVLTMLDDDSVLAALDAGAAGYLLKHARVDDVCRGIRSVASGELVVAAGAAEHVRRRLANGGRGSDVFPQLTARESDVLSLLAEGLGTAAIARRLFLTPKTVRNYVSAVLAKLPAADRDEAVAIARAAQITRASPA